MKVSFHINYHTIWGQKLYIVGSIPELGSWEHALAKELYYDGDGNWKFDLELDAIEQTIHYRYIVRNGDHTIAEEWNRNHTLNIDPEMSLISQYDFWQLIPSDLAFYSSAFTKSVFTHSSPEENGVKTNSRKKLILKLLAPHVNSDQEVVITGNQDCLGNWDTNKAIRMDASGFPEWTIVLDGSCVHFPIEYKFFVRSNDNPTPLYWESGANRIFYLPEQQDGEQITISGYPFREELPPWKGTGTVIPVFSLRSEKSVGVGDLGDLKTLIDWVKKTNQQVIQILPMNDTTMTYTWHDSYPYSAISIFALHPLYISLSMLGQLKDLNKQAFYLQKQVELNALDSLDYESTIKTKLDYCRDYFIQEKDTILSSKAFNSFINEHGSWLIPYAAYCYFRQKYGTADFKKWQDNAIYNKALAYQLASPDNPAWDEISFTFFLQYTLHTQFKTVSEYARKNGVILKGDLPIGIHRISVEAWTEPVYFNMHGQAGAPPDDFSKVGQNWGFPTYNWDIMEQDNFSWWRKRFNMLSQYFDSFRIDHILGFFRIWEVPLDYVQGLCGHFNPALPLSPEDIERYGLPFNVARFTTPHINRQYVNEIFGDLTAEVVDSYLAQSSSQHYVLKPFCDTQQKIENVFDGKTDDYSYLIKNGLFTIANEVLFLRDPYHEDKFHPRISAFQSYLYRELSDSDRYAYDHLYWDFFYHRHNEFWKYQAFKRLTPLVEGTEMLVCGEDLGMIPETVPEVMNKLQILSLEIERMPKSPNREFSDMFNLPYLSVCTTSTHDMSPLRNWWKEDKEKTQRYYNNILQRGGAAPEDCSPDIAAQILSNHLKTRAMLTIIPIQDWFAMDGDIRKIDIESERINVPSNPKHYWRYRMHVTLEKLLESDSFNEKIKSLIRESGRGT